jgi:YfiH family protein
MNNNDHTSSALKLLRPQWAAPSNVQAFMTTRIGGVSLGEQSYQGLNVGAHCGDDLTAVQANRTLLSSVAQLPSEPVWLKQTHSTTVVDAQEYSQRPTEQKTDADGSYTDRPEIVCAAMTADCLPVLISNSAGTEVAAVHAGWRGLADGVLEAGIAKFTSPVEELHIWLGAAIGPNCFEVGAEVVEFFADHDAKASLCFIQSSQHTDKWLGNLYQLAKQRLAMLDVRSVQITGGEHCTFTDVENFYSYRRDKITGRMVSLIWFN